MSDFYSRQADVHVKLPGAYYREFRLKKWLSARKREIEKKEKKCHLIAKNWQYISLYKLQKGLHIHSITLHEQKKIVFLDLCPFYKIICVLCLLLCKVLLLLDKIL